MRTPLLMRRTRGLYGPVAQPCGTSCVVRGQGNAYGSGGALAGVRPISAEVVDENHVKVYFTGCVEWNSAGGPAVGINIDGGEWNWVTGQTGMPGSIIVFSTSATIAAGDVVRAYSQEYALQDCETPPNLIGEWEIPVQNNLELPGDFMLMETGGADIIMLEDSTGEDGILLEG